MRVSTLTAELTTEFGDVVPPTLIASTVASAAVAPAADGSEVDGSEVGDREVADATARTDVAALADAVRRASPRPA